MWVPVGHMAESSERFVVESRALLQRKKCAGLCQKKPTAGAASDQIIPARFTCDLPTNLLTI
ncbi:hypothetical protein D8779_06085 [Pseudomonas leptonychotis]|uniref:Uncharacterized protein n=1 Tax=Pseudomonas leptonychotis TaxID=2448482 RepID=A0A4T2A3A6_9PSED|nr:hypothetical protein D8779_06085 [Pseudomonas leptonychotis]